MDGGPVGVAVDHAPHAVAFECRFHGGLVDVGNRLEFAFVAQALLVAATGFARLVGEFPAGFECLVKETLAPLWLASLASEGEVGRVVAAQEVTVHQQGRLAFQHHHARVWQQRCAGCRSKRRAQQEIAIAAHHVDGNAGVGEFAQACPHGLGQFAVLIVANPGLEQVAQDVQRFGPAGLRAQEMQELHRDRGARRIQMQVGDEEDRHDQGSRTAARSTTTGLTGTSPGKGARAAVGTRRILSMTSMPSTTRPNTQYPVRAGVLSLRKSNWRLSTVLMKNWARAESLSPGRRAALMVPRRLDRPLLASLGMPARSGLISRSGV